MRRSMPQATWRPASEADAVGGKAVFLEWLASVRRIPLAGPEALAAWRRDAPDDFARAIAAFAGLDEHAGVRAALFSGEHQRVALRAERMWKRGELLVAAPLPHRLDLTLAALSPADLPALAAHHLLDAGTAPDDCVPWSGDPADVLPLGAWLIDASVALRPPVSGSGGG